MALRRVLDAAGAAHARVSPLQRAARACAARKLANGVEGPALRCVDLATGELRWSVELDGFAVRMNAAPDGTRVLVALQLLTGRHDLACYDALSGEPLWRVEDAGLGHGMSFFPDGELVAVSL